MQHFAKVLTTLFPSAASSQAQTGAGTHRGVFPEKLFFRSANRWLCRPATNRFSSRWLLLLVGLLVHAIAGAGQNVTTQQYGNARSGVQSQETVLTPSNVNSSSFGKLFSFPVIGHAYAQPLYMSGLTMADGTVHNVLFVATEQDYVYAFDADGNNPAQGYLWRDFLAGANETWTTYVDVNSSDIYPDIGITGTPVIDPASGTLFVVVKSKTATGTTQYFQRLHALKLSDGSETLNGPTLIQGTVSGKAPGGSGTTVSFDPLLENQRAGLLLAATPNGSSPASIFISWASHGDKGLYHGWIISYSASDISKQTGVWCDTPDGAKGGIWMTGGALSSDDAGKIFTGTGNGTFSASTGGRDYGDSAISLAINGSSLSPTSYFTPNDQVKLDNSDLDMGISSTVLLPTQSGPIPHLAITADKSGTIYLINRDNLGGYSTGSNTSLQSFSIGNTMRTSVSFFNNTMYVAGEGGPLGAWHFDPQTEQFATTPSTTSTATFGCTDCGGAGTTAAISANGSANAIVWILDNTAREHGPAILRAYDPVNLQNVLYDSSLVANNRDMGGISIKFSVPVVVNGHVYVGGVNAVTAYGELHTSPTVSLSASPASISSGTSSTLTVTAADADLVTVTGSDGSSYTLSPTGGAQTVSPTTTTTYTATAEGNKSKVTASTTVTVGPAVTAITLSANPASIPTGGSSTLTVTATSATQVSVTGTDGSSYSLSPTGGTQKVSPTATTTYTATAVGASSNATASATVTVGATAATVSLSASPTSIAAGSASTLTVTAGNATQVRVTGSDGSSYTLPPAGGTQTVTPTATTTYTATAVGTGSNATATATVSVTFAAPAVTFSASPASISAGGSSLLTASATSATQVTITGSDGSSYRLSASGGTQSVTPAATTTYTATASGGNGTPPASATTTVTVTPVSGGCLPSGAGTIICAPTSGAGIGSPVTITAGSTAASGNIAALRAYIDNVAVLTVNNPAATKSFQFSQAVTVATGSHHLVIVGYQTGGAALDASEYFTVTSGSTAPTIALSASPSSISPGASSTLTVTASNATQVTVSGSDGSSYSLPASGGSQRVSPSATTTYTATAVGSSSTATATATVSVGAAVTTVSLIANPTTISAGSSSTLTVTAANATQVTLTGSDGSSYTLSPAGGTQTVSPTATTTYTATAVGASSRPTATATVTVRPPGATITVSANPASVLAGGSSLLTVAATNATQVILIGSDGSSYRLPTSGGTQSVTPSATTTYTASATGSSGTVSATATVTVTGNSGGCLPSGPGAAICSPSPGASASSPVTITAGAVAGSGNIAAIRAYIDNVAVLTVNNPSATSSFQFSQPVPVSAGSHSLVVVGYQTTGGIVKTSVTFTVGGGTTGCVPSSAGAIICSPGQNATVSSPVTISAGATASSGYIAAIRIYVDNISQSLVNNPQQGQSFTINQPISMTPGNHNVVIVAYESSGGALTASEALTVQ